MIKNVLVTGCTGFIGTHLINSLKSNKKYNVIALSSKEINGIKTILHNNYSFRKDIFYLNDLEYIDIVIHAGAFIPKSGNDSDNIYLSNSNIINTQYLISNLPPVKKFIFLSTIDVYILQKIISEKSETNPSTLYGWSKLYCEKMLEKWSKDTNTTLRILRIGHIYGPGEEAYKKLIPMSIKKCLLNQSPVIFSDGSEKRSYLYISECIQAIINSIDLIIDSEIINIVSEENLSVLEVVSIIKDYINPGINIIVKGNNKNIKNYKFSATKMKRLLLDPEIDFRSGIKNEIDKFNLYV